MEPLVKKKPISQRIVTGLLILYGVVISVLVNLPAILKGNYGGGGDWNYFNHLSLFVRSCILQYKTFLMYDPWLLGGMDEFTNLQNRIFSPMGILDILFPPQTANIIMLIIFGTIGFIGCYYLLKHYKISFLVNVVCSTIFMNAQWYGLHYSEGHLGWGTFLIIPWVLFAIVNIYEKKYMFLYTALCILFILDGGNYTFIFSLVLLLFCLLFRIVDYKRIFNKSFIKENWWYLLLLSLFLTLMILVKIIPGMAVIMGSRFESMPIPLNFIKNVFFTIEATPLLDGLAQYKFHEFGSYLGFVSLIIITIYLCNKKNITKSFKFLVIAMFFFWISTGLGDPFNPWTLVANIPVLNAARIQSRYTLLLYLFWIILLAFALQRLKINKFKWFNLIVLFLVIESFFVRVYPMYFMFNTNDTNQPAIYNHTLITNTNLTETVSYAIKPATYFDNPNKGVKDAYEFGGPVSKILCIDDPGYRGEIYFKDPAVTGKVSYKEVIPGKVTFEYQLDNPDQLPAVIEMNLNYLSGWKVLSGSALIYKPDKLDLIKVQVNTAAGKVVIQYNPWYLGPAIAAYIAGLLLGVFLFLISVWKRRDKQADKISAIQ